MDKKTKRYLQLEDQDTFFGPESVASATECTGLIPDSPGSVAEAESYTEIYDIPTPEDDVNNGLQHE